MASYEASDDDDADIFNAKSGHATLGQMAEQVQAKARADAKAKGIDDYPDEEFDYAEYDGSLCQPGSEHTGRWTKLEHEMFLEALRKYGKVLFLKIF